MSFSELGLVEPIVRAVTAAGYSIPTPIQAQAIPVVIAGRDLLGVAQTGTGKTAAFSLPIIQRLVQNGNPAKGAGRKIRVLVLSPTRELAAQIGQSIATYSGHTALRHTVVFGGVSQFHQVQALKNGVDILVATPGRLMDLQAQGHINLSNLQILVLDEADRMLDMGFLPTVKKICAGLPRERQTLFFSATMPPEVRDLSRSILRDPVSVEIAPVAATAALIEQSVYLVEKQHKTSLLRHLLKQDGMARALVFTRTKHGADKLARLLHEPGFVAEAIHGNRSQSQRERALSNFKRGRTTVLVATDLAARGLDVDGITHVFNFDLPREPDNYVHRIGRTGRAGANGIAISFCARDERSQLRDIERLLRRSLQVRTDLPQHVLDLLKTGGDQVEQTSTPKPATSSYARRPVANHSTSDRRSSIPVPSYSDTPRTPNRARRFGKPVQHRDARPIPATNANHSAEAGTGTGVPPRDRSVRRAPRPRGRY
ncbi:MAG: DEAD/DEAH box helicase [Planctomycetales bacterium]|nr:DEAD/DEAH box helicase [Planctomycetales bacterium]